MLEGIKRWFSAAPGEGPMAGTELGRWAAQRGFSLREVPGEGFVIDGMAGGVAWRMEWGPSQRGYIAGNELRLRAAPGVAPELHAALMTRRLAESLERRVFDDYVEGVQTRLDVDAPPEMRWLVLLPRLPAAHLGPLRSSFVAVGNSQRWLGHWLEAALPALLAGALPGLLPGVDTAEEAPLMLGLTRGRLTLRTPLADAEPRLLQGWLRVFETALREARRAAEQSAADTGPSTSPESDWVEGEEPPVSTPGTLDEPRR
jgi:hypothetical protein